MKKIIQISDVNPGDIVLFRPKEVDDTHRKIIEKIGIPYVHAGICCGRNEIAHVSQSKIERRRIRFLVRAFRNLAVFRSLVPWSEEQVVRVNEFVDRQIKKGVQFSIDGIRGYRNAKSNHDESVGELLLDQERLPEYSFDPYAVFCSEFVAQCCAKSGRLSGEVVKLYRPDVQSPKDIISDSAFANKFVGFLASDESNVCNNDPFLKNGTFCELLASVASVQNYGVDPADAEEVHAFQKEEVDAFNASVDTPSLMVPPRKEKRST